MNEQETAQTECPVHDPVGEAEGRFSGDTVNNVSNDETSLALEILCNQVENDSAKA
jgi:hypothetical protein